MAVKRKHVEGVASSNENLSKDKKVAKLADKNPLSGGNKGKKLPKETAATRRERKRVRKMQKPSYEISCQAMKLWEKLRRNKNKISKKECADLVNELMGIVKKMDKKLINLMYAHDTSRVVQTCLKQGNPDQRKAIYAELKNEIIDMSKNRYAKNMVWKLLKYGTPEQRDEIIHQFAGQVPKLIRKDGPASVIEFAYNVYANKKQRNFLAHQFYGNSFNIAKSEEDTTLEDVFKEQPEKKEVILKNFKQSLVPLVEKRVITHTIVHRVFDEFFMFCDDSVLRSELIELLRESVIHIMHTRDGVRVTMQCLWHGTAKDRKVIVKTMKEFVPKLCQEEYGHLALLAAFDSVDDTVFIKKALILPIVKLLPDIIQNKYARKVLLYLVSPRNASHFLPETIQLLSKGDNNNHSKKPLATRHKELSEAISPGLIEYVASHTRQLACDRSLFVLVEAVINHCHGDVAPVTTSLIELADLPFEAGVKDENGMMHLIEDPAGHLLIKRLVAHKSANGNQKNFGEALLKSVTETNLCSWSSCNRGSQVLLSLLQCPNEDVAKLAKKLLKRNEKSLQRHKDIKSTVLLLEKLT